MSDPTTTGGLDFDDQRTHLERINTEDHGVVPEVASPLRGARRLYRMLVKGLHNGRLFRPGEIVELWEGEAGPHHVPVEDDGAEQVPAAPAQVYMPSAEPVPVPSVMPAPSDTLPPPTIDPQVVRLEGRPPETETVHYADGTSATGPGPLPRVSPDGALAVPSPE